MPWGVFSDDDPESIDQHVAPSTADGQILNGHKRDGLTCWCSPVRDMLVIVHNDCVAVTLH